MRTRSSAALTFFFALTGVLGSSCAQERDGAAEETPQTSNDPAAPPTPRLGPPEDPPYEYVVLVTIDTLRSDHLPSYGYRRQTAPFLEHMASRGALFENAFATVSHTAPSHATMLTGLPARVHGVRRNGNKLDEGIPALPGLLRERGFASGAFLGAGFLGAIARGFDHKANVSATATQQVDKAIAWSSSQTGPFFIWLHLFEPHRWRKPKLPQWARAEIADGWKGAGGSLYDYVAGLHGFPPLAADAPFELPWSGGDGTGLEHMPTSREEVIEYVDAYDALIRFADAEIQRLYEALQGAGGKKALWIVTSDHGEGLGSHGYEGHGGRIYNEQLRAALVFHATDDSLAPRRLDRMVSHMDLVPTLAELTGFTWTSPAPENLGRSLVPLLRGQESEFPQRLVFAEQRRAEQAEAGDAGEMVAIQDSRHKLIRNPDGREEFFALEQDPLEQADVGADDARRLELRAALDRLLQAYSRISSGALVEPEPEFLRELQDLGYAR